MNGAASLVALLDPAQAAYYQSSIKMPSDLEAQPQPPSVCQPTDELCRYRALDQLRQYLLEGELQPDGHPIPSKVQEVVAPNGRS